MSDNNSNLNNNLQQNQNIQQNQLEQKNNPQLNQNKNEQSSSKDTNQQKEGNAKKDEEKEKIRLNYEMSLEYENFLRQEIEQTTPLISEELPVSILLDDYKLNQEYSKSVKQITDKYKYIRKVRRDGNCFYRSFIYVFLNIFA